MSECCKSSGTLQQFKADLYTTYLLLGLSETGDVHEQLSLVHHAILDQLMHSHFVTKQQKGITYTDG